MTLNFRFSGKLGSLITSRHAFRSSWNFQKLMQVRYTSNLRTFQVVKNFSILMLNISSVKELLYTYIFWGTLGAWEPMWNFMVFWYCEFLKVSAYLLVKKVLTRFFHLFWIYFRWYYQKKIFYIKITIVPGDIDAKKPRKTFHKLEMKNSFSMLTCEFFIVMSIYGSKCL